MTATHSEALPRWDLSYYVKAPSVVKVESFRDEVRRGNIIRAGKFTSAEDTGEAFVPDGGNTGPGEFFDAEIAATRRILRGLKLLP